MKDTTRGDEWGQEDGEHVGHDKVKRGPLKQYKHTISFILKNVFR